MSTTDPERLARTAYEVYRRARPGSLPPWEEAADEEQNAWKLVISAVTGQGEATLAEGKPVKALVVQLGDQTHVFQNDFIVGRQGNLNIGDDHASGHHALFQSAHSLWYVEDLGSTNGTWLNGRRIYSSQRLKKGDKVKIGRTTITVVSA